MIYILLGILVLWIAGVTYYLRLLVSHYQRLTEGTTRRSLKEALDKILSDVETERKEREALTVKIDSLTEDVVHHIQKVGILRFNPFADTGGDQSFVLTMLDGNDTGIILSSLHNRGITRWYAKNVKEGKGVDHELSAEEKKAIQSAQRIVKEKPKTK